MSDAPTRYSALIEAVSGEVIERFKATAGEVLDRLDRAREGATDNQSFSIARADTAEELEAVIPDRIAKGRLFHQERQEALSRLPQVLGEPEIDKATWDQLRTDYGADAGRLANHAAHSWAIMPPDDGFILAVGHGLYGERWEPGPTRPRKLEPGEVPTICQNCVHTRRYLGTRRVARALVCDIGKPEGISGGVLRKVGRIQTCAGWKAA